ncbi:MAG: imidazoleglycerol-phosphate dehydratase [Candidatus Omnitrophica bacterium CG07_land_8_20_14_0_80_50_8]|nr:MAG: imidazoleglycerol-phosphate dehydratase [Candidatus Omnitrophica bacterium CG07_land_8_20_14_0_80_50_8]
MKKRKATARRKTKETAITVHVTLDGSGKSQIHTGIRFLDHMIESFAKHGFFDIELTAVGDLDVDTHHTNEDVGIALGEAFNKALGDKKGIRRFADYRAPLDEALSGTRVTIDVSGRGSCHLHTNAKTKWLDDPAIRARQNSMRYTLADAKHFLESFAYHLGMTLHIDFISGEQPHHVIEATFKSLAKALDFATQIDERSHAVPSTKGKL